MIDQDPRNPQDERHDRMADDAVKEIKGMAKGGLDHPATKPVLIGAGIGAAAAAVLPFVGWPVGLVAGAAVALYRRVDR